MKLAKMVEILSENLQIVLVAVRENIHSLLSMSMTFDRTVEAVDESNERI